MSTSTSTSTGGNQAKSIRSIRPNARASSISDASTLVHPLSRQHQRTNLGDKPAKLDYTTINGRRYLTSPDARFFSPVDEDESDRLVIMHFLLKYAFGCSFKAPIGDRLRGRDRCQILDIGCGPGTWVLEMASDFPNAEFFGVDLVRMYPSAIKPSNAKFLQHDILNSLPFPDGSLDYVHMRMMLCNLTQAQTLHLLSEINRVLKPGGFVELMDVEYRVERAGPLNEELLN
ncbi:S-adenosyl-L-methionine-dependent methyltransferase, partial [Dichotomocladium elegans]